MTDEQRRALDAYENARSKLGKLNGKSGQGSENTYAAAYAKLVALGMRPQLRGRYR